MPTRSLEKVRAELDKIDEQIIELIERRTRLAEDILAAKMEANVGIDDPDRTKKVLKRAGSRAAEKGLDVEAVKRIFEILVEMNTLRQKELMGRFF